MGGEMASLIALPAAEKNKPRKYFGCELRSILKVAYFLIFAVSCGLCPIFYQLALYDPQLNRKVITFVPPLVHALSSSLALLSALIIEFGYWRLKHKDKFVKPAFFKAFMPFGALTGVSDSVEIGAMALIDGGLRTVVLQMKLPVTSLLRCFLLETRQPRSIWLTVTCVTVAILAYVARQLVIDVDDMSKELIGVGLAFLVTSAGATGCVAGESRFKRYAASPLHRKTLGARSASATVLWIACLLFVTFTGRWHDLITFRGLGNPSIWFLIVFLTVRDYIYIQTLDILDASFIALANCLGLFVAYLGDVFVFQKPFDIQTALLLFNVALLVAIYAELAREQRRLREKSLQIDVAQENKLSCANQTCEERNPLLEVRDIKPSLDTRLLYSDGRIVVSTVVHTQ